MEVCVFKLPAASTVGSMFAFSGHLLTGLTPRGDPDLLDVLIQTRTHTQTSGHFPETTHTSLLSASSPLTVLSLRLGDLFFSLMNTSLTASSNFHHTPAYVAYVKRDSDRQDMEIISASVDVTLRFSSRLSTLICFKGTRTNSVRKFW